MNVIESLDSSAQNSDGLDPQRKTNSFSDDPRWLAARRIVASESFVKASRLSSFLLYVCEKAIKGCTDEISEQQIGVNVFARSSDYNPGDDNIVRSVARQLRQRLALYYQEEGSKELWRISIPRGGYVPVFELLPSAEAPAAGPQAPVLSRTSVPIAILASRRWKYYVSAFSLFLLGMLTMVGWQHLLQTRRSKTPTHPLWSLMFTPQRRTVIVAGDAGLNMFTNLARREVSVPEYDSRSYLNSPFAETPKGYTWTPLVRRDYTSFADLLLVSKLVQRPEVIPDRLDVRFARHVSMEDLKDPNVILIGSENYNPWVHLFQSNANFDLVWNGETNTTEITNGAPQPGEQASYQPGQESITDHRYGYAIIDFINRSDSGNRVLTIEGTSMLGISAAGDFLSQETEFGKVLQKARTSNGGLTSFEVLLQSEFVDGNTQNTHVIATRFHP